MPSGLTWSRLCLPNFKRNTVYQFLWPPDRATDVHDGHDGHDLCLAASQPEARELQRCAKPSSFMSFRLSSGEVFCSSKVSSRCFPKQAGQCG